jgi:hypothetical protein
MEWTIKIEDKPKERILVEYVPTTGNVYARGQYRINNAWEYMTINSVEQRC